MDILERRHLQAEANFLLGQLATLPERAVLTRMSTTSRLKAVEARLAEALASEAPHPVPRGVQSFAGPGVPDL